ncbi:uncharacterized protein LOC112904337 [Agrilus planipennis]|uniref:Uncharacterized protein LOC112904337 n=1 Tax=Agrilus planipennis TaxID=224129 RepID=A0A7F5R3M3_AGRPL|nr:uncharacterized protein LOC112904337 [Agrilus planipennis]
MWCYRRMMRIPWIQNCKNKEVLERVEEHRVLWKSMGSRRDKLQQTSASASAITEVPHAFLHLVPHFYNGSLSVFSFKYNNGDIIEKTPPVNTFTLTLLTYITKKKQTLVYS